MSPSRSFVLILMTLLTATIHAEDQPKSEHLTAEDRRLFAWFDKLGFEDFTQARLVRIGFGDWPRIGPPQPVRTFDEPWGFVLWEKEGQFCVLLDDLTLSVVDGRAADPKATDHLGWRATSPEQEAGALLRLLEKSATDGYNDPPMEGGANLAWSFDRLRIRPQIFVFARYCAANHREDLAARLMRAIEKLPPYDPNGTLQNLLGLGFENIRLWRTTEALADIHQDRHALSAIFKRTSEFCQRSPLYERQQLDRTAHDLEKMAAEDDAHAKISADDFARLSPADQAREFIFQLRDEYAPSYEEWPRPFPFAEPTGNGSFNQLVALGFAAVPALLDTIPDERPTRTVELPGNRGFITSISMGELATRALSKIANLDFRNQFPNPGTFTEKEIMERTHAVAADWWKTTQEKGDAAWLCARITAGQDESMACLSALATRHPKEEPPFLMKYIPSVTNQERRATLLSWLYQTNSPEVNNFLRNEMQHGPSLWCRVTAARGLSGNDQPEGLGTMLNELEILTPQICAPEKPGQAIPERPWGYTPPPDSVSHLLRFLLTANSPLAIREVQALLPRAQGFVRDDAVMWGYDMVVNNRLDGAGNPSPATLQAAEALLVAELGDEASFGEYDGVKDAVLADKAAGALAQRWPKKYHFDIHQSPAERTAQRAAMRARFDAGSTLPATTK